MTAETATARGQDTKVDFAYAGRERVRTSGEIARFTGHPIGEYSVENSLDSAEGASFTTARIARNRIPADPNVQVHIAEQRPGRSSPPRICRLRKSNR